MTLAGAWQLIKEAFDASPYLGAVVALIFWLGFCWKFRLVDIGNRRSLPEMLLSAFTVPFTETNGIGLEQLHVKTVEPKSPTNPKDRPETTSSGDQARTPWKLADVYQVYWALVARGQVVRYTTVLVTFSALSLLVMYVAQPTDKVSLLSVANVVGVGAVLPLAVLGLLALVVLLLSAHQLPCSALSTKKPLTVILFAW